MTSIAQAAFDGMLELRELLLNAGYKVEGDGFVPSVVRTVKQILEALIDETDPQPPTTEWMDRVAGLERELANRELHTCHDQCQRPGCVEGRRLREIEDAARAHRAEVQAEEARQGVVILGPSMVRRLDAALARPPGEPA